MNTKEALLIHANAYPLLKPEDVFKFIYQSVFGCEHMVEKSPYITEFIIKEANDKTKRIIRKSEILDGEYTRVHLGYIKNGLNPDTLGKLFYLSSLENKGSLKLLIDKLDNAKELALKGGFPFNADEFLHSLGQWEANGFPAIHHSEAFGKAYRPAYRVIANKYAALIPLLSEIDKISSQETVILAIDGGSATGKTTLSAHLGKIYDCNIFHADDFFLQPHQRTERRLSEPGGNLDRERLSEQVLIPLSEGKPVNFQRYDCSTGQLMPSAEIMPKRINIIEGAYSMHPDLCKYYNLSVFLEISPEAQKERILKRNPRMAERFFSEWIPLEKIYFEHFGIKEKCAVVL